MGADDGATGFVTADASTLGTADAADAAFGFTEAVSAGFSGDGVDAPDGRLVVEAAFGGAAAGTGGAGVAGVAGDGEAVCSLDGVA